MVIFHSYVSYDYQIVHGSHRIEHGILKIGSGSDVRIEYPQNIANRQKQILLKWLWINTYRYSLLGDEHP